MDLFPTIDVTLAKKTKAVWALCKKFHADELRKDYLSEFVPGTFDE